MALTKTTTALDATQEIAQNTVLEGATIDVSGMYEALLQIWWALTNATAHTGTLLRIQHSTDTTGDEDWGTLLQVVVGIGTTNLEVITNNPLAIGDGPTNAITVASLTGYAAAQWVFLEDVSTFANSEWLFVVSTSVEAGDDHIHTLDGVTRQHAINSILNSVAGMATPIVIPFATQRIRIVYDNTFDTDGATVAIKSQLVGVTAI